MTKRYLLLIGCLFLSAVVSAESMSFVTTLSQPTGLFQNVDVLGTDTTNTKLLSFCGGKASLCNMSIEKAFQANVLTLSKSANLYVNLEGSVAKYYVDNFTLQGSDYGAGTGDESLVAGSFTMRSSSSFHADSKVKIFNRVGSPSFTGFPSEFKTKIASFDNMTITNTASFTKNAITDKMMTWGSHLCASITSSCPASDKILYSPN